MPDASAYQADTFPNLLARSAALFGDAPAMASPAARHSFREIEAASAALARGLIAQSVGKGSRVALLAGNTFFFCDVLFACASIGAILVPVSTVAAPAEVALILKHCDAQILLCERHYNRRDYGPLLAEALPSLADARAGAPLRLPEAPFLRAIWVDDCEGLCWANPLADMLAAGARDTALDAAFLAELTAQVTPADEVVIIYTSGSTSAPKAVMHRQGPIVRQSFHLADMQIGAIGDRVLALLPFFWVGGLALLIETIAKGACSLVAPDLSTEGIADTIRDLDPHVVYGWPAQRARLRRFLDARGQDYHRTRLLRDDREADGSLIPFEKMANALGMTETFWPHGMLHFDTRVPPGKDGAFAPAGGGFERRVVDPETGEVLPTGGSGELQVRGGALMAGYYKSEPAEVFTPDGFFRTNDIVRIDEEGWLFFEGRMGDMLKTRGANVSRLEVEAALRKNPDVLEAVVCGLPDPEQGQIVCAAIVPRDSALADEASIRSALAGEIASYKVPAHIVFIAAEELAWSATGKLRVPETAKLIARRIAER